MLPTDPKEAAKLGKAWGEVLADSIFGVADVLKNSKQMKAAANKKQLQQNQLQAIKNAKIRADNFKKQKEMERDLHDREVLMLATMSKAEKEEYQKMKIQAMIEQKRLEREAAESAEAWATFWQIVLVLFITIFGLWGIFMAVGFFMHSSSPYAYQELSKIVPFMKTIIGK